MRNYDTKFKPTAITLLIVLCLLIGAYAIAQEGQTAAEITQMRYEWIQVGERDGLPIKELTLVPINGKVDDCISMSDLLKYQEVCYNDSTMSYDHVGDCFRCVGNAEGMCIALTHHYKWVPHRKEPTFTGFIEFLKSKQ